MFFFKISFGKKSGVGIGTSASGPAFWTSLFDYKSKIIKFMYFIVIDIYSVNHNNQIDDFIVLKQALLTKLQHFENHTKIQRFVSAW